MSLTNGQKRALHQAARLAGLSDAQRRLLQRHLGGFASCADRGAGRYGFIRVMAAIEQHAEGRGVKLPFAAGYWRRQAAAARPTDALLHAVRAEAGRLGMSEDSLLRFLRGPHMSGEHWPSLEATPPRWLGKLLDALKAMAARTGPAAPRAAGGS